jgi:transposase
MAAWRRAIELSLGDADTAKLRSIAQSRTEPASRVERARILLAYREDPSFFAVSRALGLHHQTVQRRVERAVAEGPMAALEDRPRPGREPTITLEAKAWLVSLACPQGEGPRLSPRSARASSASQVRSCASARRPTMARQADLSPSRHRPGQPNTRVRRSDPARGYGRDAARESCSNRADRAHDCESAGLSK